MKYEILKRVADFGLHVVLHYCGNDGSRLLCLGYIGERHTPQHASSGTSCPLPALRRLLSANLGETAGGRCSGTSATHNTICSRCKTGLATRGIKSPRQARARDALQRHRPYVSSAAAVTGWRCSELRLHGPPNERRHTSAGLGVPSHAPPQTPPATPTRPKALSLRWTLG